MQNYREKNVNLSTRLRLKFEFAAGERIFSAGTEGCLSTVSSIFLYTKSKGGIYHGTY